MYYSYSLFKGGTTFLKVGSTISLSKRAKKLVLDLPYLAYLGPLVWPRLKPVVFATHVAERKSFYHRLNGSSSPVLTATSLSYGKAKNSTPTESKPLIWLR